MKELLSSAFTDEEQKVREDGEREAGDEQKVVTKKINVAETVIHFFFVNYQGMRVVRACEMKVAAYTPRQYSDEFSANQHRFTFQSIDRTVSEARSTRVSVRRTRRSRCVGASLRKG